MSIGDYAPALIVATWRRAPSLGLLVLAAQLLAVAFRLLALAGVEHYAIEPWYTTLSPLYVYDAPWTHSLLGALGFAAAWAVAARLLRVPSTTAYLGAMMIVFAWLGAVVVHPGDLTLAGGAPRFGWGWWNHPYALMPLELLAGLCALTHYANATHAPDWRGRATLALLAAALVGFQLAEWLWPMPREAADPAPAAVSLSALAAYTIIAVLAWWTGETRRAR